MTTHASLLARLTDGTDAEAWHEFCARYGDLICGFARHQGLQAADCDDILQEVLTALTKSMPGFEYDPSKGKFRGYLKTITVRAVARRSCQNRGVVSLEEVETATHARLGNGEVEDLWEADWRQHHLRQAMKIIAVEFNKEEVAAFQAYGLDGQDATEVAAATGMSVGYVYKVKSRILKRMKELVEQQIADEG